MGDQFITLLVRSLTQGVRMVLLSLMVLSRKWSATKFDTNVKFTSIDQTTILVCSPRSIWSNSHYRELLLRLSQRRPYQGIWHSEVDCTDSNCYYILQSKTCYRSVSGLTGTGSSRWSGSQVPALPGEVVHRSEPTGSPVWTGSPVEMSSQLVIVDLVSSPVWQLFIDVSRNSVRTTVLKLWHKNYQT
jgi:hypothetical protein